MVSITNEPRPLCDLCGSKGELVQSGIADPDGQISGSWSFQRCINPKCGVCWLDPAPLPEELWKAYATYHTHTRKSGHRLGKSMLSLAHRLVRLLLLPVWIASGLKREADYLRFMTLFRAPKGRLLDVGCGGGRFMNRMKRSGWEVEGTDFDEQAAKRVMKRYGIRTHVGDLPQCFLQADSFDVITMSQTIEHLYAPDATLRECLRILKPDGILVMTTPNAKSLCAAEFGACWRGWEAPRHLHLFTVDSLQSLTQNAGFEVIEACTYSSGSAVVYRASRNCAQGEPRSWIKQLLLLVSSYRKELHEHRMQKHHLHTGQNILIRARKPGK